MLRIWFNVVRCVLNEFTFISFTIWKTHVFTKIRSVWCVRYVKCECDFISKIMFPISRTERRKGYYILRNKTSKNLFVFISLCENPNVSVYTCWTFSIRYRYQVSNEHHFHRNVLHSFIIIIWFFVKIYILLLL